MKKSTLLVTALIFALLFTGVAMAETMAMPSITKLTAGKGIPSGYPTTLSDRPNPPAGQLVPAGVPVPGPVMILPYDGQVFNHYPRVVSLVWKPVSGAKFYLVERAYYGNAWVYYPVVNISGQDATTLTFTFVGDNYGAWRVTSYVPNQGLSSGNWWLFGFNTRNTLEKPTVVSPNAVNFYNYPRTTTLIWKPVPGATNYTIERQYLSGSTWYSYSPVTIKATTGSYYQFTFVGKQPGRWRVTALPAPGSNWFSSSASDWGTFTYYI